MTATTTRHDARTADGPAHFGMEIMKGRADRLGGTIEVGQNDGGGTRVRLSVPVGAPAAVLPAHSGAGNG